MTLARTASTLLALSLLLVPVRADGPADAAAKQKQLAERAAELLELEMSADDEPDPEVMKKAEALQKEVEALAEELGGKDTAGKEKAVKDALRAHRPDVYAKIQQKMIRAREVAAVSMLKTLCIAEATIRMSDDDGNQAADYWVADVSGLCRIRRAGDKAGIEILDAGTAWADAAPAVPLGREGSLAAGKDGAEVPLVPLPPAKREPPYRLAAMRTYEGEAGEWRTYDDGRGRNASKFGFCAFPQLYGETGRTTFIVGEDGVIWKKDLGGLPAFAMPLDPKAEGWTALD